MYKKIPFGIKDFKTLILEDYYYVDKTLLIKEILASCINQFYFVFPAAGKTLTLSMIQYFFEDTGNLELNIEHQKLFVNTNIYLEPYFSIEACNYIVITLELPVSMHYTPEPTLNGFLQHWKEYFSNVFSKYCHVKTALCMKELELFEHFINCQVTNIELLSSINFLLHCLAIYYKKKCILIIDDFTINISYAKKNEFGAEFIKFYSTLLDNVLLSDGLKFVIYAGQPLFDADEFLIDDTNKYDSYFSFTEKETKELLSYYGLSERYDFVMKWCGNDKIHLFNAYLMTEYLFHIIVCKQGQDELTTRWFPIEFLLFIDKLLNNPEEYKKFTLLSNGSDVSVSINSEEYKYMIKCGMVNIVSKNTNHMIVRITNYVSKFLIKKALELYDMFD